MPVLILLGIFAGYGAVKFVQSCQTPAQPRGKTKSEQMTNEMIGKSKRECRRILRHYRQERDIVYLLVTILILLVWAVYSIIKAAQPASPPIEDMEQHLKHIQSLPNKKSETEIFKKEEIKREINHKVVCLDCGHVYTRTKASKLITHTSRYRCGCCHGKLKLEY